MKQLPNIFTLLNLVFGCLAIVFILQNGIALQYSADGGQYAELPEKIVLGSVLIGLAAIIDFFDGFVARLFNASSEMGRQLDSLADVVSFGVAPSMIIYQFLRAGFARQENGIEVNTLWLLPAFLIAAAGAYRLARFNIDKAQQYGFKGSANSCRRLAHCFFSTHLLVQQYRSDKFYFAEQMGAVCCCCTGKLVNGEQP